MTNPDTNQEQNMVATHGVDATLAELDVDPAVARLMNRTRGRRFPRLRIKTARAVRRLLLAVLVLGALTACGPADLNNAPLTPIPAPATTR